MKDIRDGKRSEIEILSGRAGIPAGEFQISLSPAGMPALPGFEFARFFQHNKIHR